jgi:hypothetical protein
VHGVFDESFGPKDTKSIGDEVIQPCMDRMNASEPRKKVCCNDIHVKSRALAIGGGSGNVVRLGSRVLIAPDCGVGKRHRIDAGEHRAVTAAAVCYVHPSSVGSELIG